MKQLSSLWVLLFVLMVSHLVHAQQPTQYSLFPFNKYQYNLAYAGLDNSLSITGVFRKQWLSFPGSPMHFGANAHLPIEYINSAAGLGIEYDALGEASALQVNGSYNYILDLNKKGRLSIGIGGRMIQHTLNGDGLTTPGGLYEGANVNHKDPFLTAGKMSGTSLGIDFGLYYKHPRVEIGIASINIPEASLSLSPTTIVGLKRNYFMSAQYVINLSDDLILKPSLLVKTDFIKFQPEILALFEYNNNILAGLAFRGYNSASVDAAVVVLGMRLNPNITVAYGYDLSLGALQQFNTGSHELVFNYNLNKKIGKEIPVKVIYNPRFL